MIICVCRRLNEAAVKTAIAAGAQRPEEVHAFHGCKHKCGKCLCMIDDMIGSDMTAGREAQQIMAAE